MAIDGWHLAGRCRGHERLIGQFAWSPDFREIATPAGDGRLVVWNVESRRPRISGQVARGLHAVAWSHTDGVLAVLASADGPNLDPDRELDTEYPELAYEDSLLEAFSSTGPRETFVPPQDADGPLFIRLIDADSGLQIGTLSSPEVTDMPWDIRWLPDGQHLATASSDGIALWHARDGYFLGFCESSGRRNYYGACSLGQQQQLLAGATSYGQIGIWDATTGALSQSFPSASYDPLCVSFAPGHNRLAVAYSKGLVQVLDYAGSDVDTHSLEAHTADVSSVSFSLDGRLLATTSLDGTIRLWDLATWTLLGTRPDATMRQVFGRVSFGQTANAPEPMLAATAETGKSLVLWSLDVPALAARQRRPKTVH